MHTRKPDPKVHHINTVHLTKAMSQMPRLIEELQQVQQYLITCKPSDQIDTDLARTYRIILKVQTLLLQSLPLGILKPNEFKTPDPLDE